MKKPVLRGHLATTNLSARTAGFRLPFALRARSGNSNLRFTFAPLRLCVTFFCSLLSLLLRREFVCQILFRGG